MSAPRKEALADGVELWLGDCRDVLPLIGRVDAVVTDPVWPNCPKGTIAGADQPWVLWAEACGLMPQHERMIVVMRCDSDPRFLAPVRLRSFVRSIVLPYVMPAYLGRVLGGDETAYWFGSPIATGKGRMVHPRDGGHPFGLGPPAEWASDVARLEAHFDCLVWWCADVGETVLDPFMGSGTTGVACARLGLSFHRHRDRAEILRHRPATDFGGAGLSLACPSRSRSS